MRHIDHRSALHTQTNSKGYGYSSTPITMHIVLDLAFKRAGIYNNASMKRIAETMSESGMAISYPTLSHHKQRFVKEGTTILEDPDSMAFALRRAFGRVNLNNPAAIRDATKEMVRRGVHLHIPEIGNTPNSPG